MKKALVMLAVLFGSVPLSSQAQTFYIGGEVGSAIYPDFTDQVARATVNAGFSSAEVKQDRSGLALGIYGGVWFTPNIGLEAAYTDLGEVEGTVTTVPVSNTFYKYSANAASLAALGGIKLGRGTLYGKVGAYRASVDFKSATRTISTDSSGLIYGGGYSFPFTRHVVGKVELAVYNDVKFQTFNAPQGTNTSDDIIKFTIGVAYAF